jgi:hypothetical protein
MARVLDIQEPQVCVNFPDDPQFTWHHRILLCRVTAGRWLTLTPDHEIIAHNLNVIPNIVLDRGGEFPPGIRNHTYAFDPIDAASLTVFKRRAKLQAAILGESEGLEAQQALVWVFSDPTDALFGTILDKDVMDDPGRGAAINDDGVALHEGLVRHVVRIARDDLDEWRKERRSGAHDQRTLGVHFDANGVRHLRFRDAVNMMKADTHDEWTFDGPIACPEFLAAVVQGAGNPVSYHSEWVRLSGVAEGSAVCHDHRHLMECLRLGACVDQLDLMNLALTENIVRRIIQIETAVERNPRHPDFTGLGVVEGGVTTDKGAARVPKFREHIAARQKERAQILRHERLYKEEQEKEWKNRRQGGGGNDDDKSKGKKQKQKDGKKAKKGKDQDAGGSGDEDN